MNLETFDFQRYIAEHKDPGKRTGAFSIGEYAYRGDVRLLRTLHTLAPVRLMTGATLKLWRGWGRKKLLKNSTRASEQEARRVFDLANKAARTLHMTPQIIYITPGLQGEFARALGVEDEVFIVLQPSAAISLGDDALSFIIGRELGHIQNDHVLHHTAAFYSNELAGIVVKWATAAAVLSLNTWRQRSELTADRAGLICCQDLKVASQQIARQSLAGQRLDADIDVQAVLDGSSPPPSSGFFQRFGERLPDLRLRIRALEVFSESQYYRELSGSTLPGGRTLTEVDDAVEEMIKNGIKPRSSQEGE